MTKNIKMINWFGRFGNNIVEITSGIYLAKHTKVKFLHDKHDLIEGREYDFSEQPASSDKIMRSRELYHIADIPFADRIQICHTYIRPRLKWLNHMDIPNSTLVIHIRSGDLFDGYCTCPKTGKRIYCNVGLYAQPPFAFYKKIIDDNTYKRILVITEKDRRNPVIQMLQDEYEHVTVQSGTFEEDANTILHAKHLVPSVGTFSLSLCMLSKTCEKLYLIKGYISPPRLDVDMDSSGINIEWLKLIDYIPLGKWVLNDANVEKIKSHPISSILYL